LAFAYCVIKNNSENQSSLPFADRMFHQPQLQLKKGEGNAGQYDDKDLLMPADSAI
jgi:hypothetical protein